MSDILNVYPQRLSQKLEDTSTVFTARKTRSSKGRLFIVDQYTNNLISYDTSQVEPKNAKSASLKRDNKQKKKSSGSRCESVSTTRTFQRSNSARARATTVQQIPTLVAKVTKKANIPKKRAGSCLPPNIPSKRSTPDSDFSSNRPEVNCPAPIHSSQKVDPVYVLGKIALEYENFELSPVCEGIRTLACFDKKHESSLLPVLKLADREVTASLCYRNTEDFYKNEFIPALENLKKFWKDPSEFHDVNADLYELSFEDGLIIESPLPPRPEIFPHQILQRMRKNIGVEVARENEERELREEEQQRTKSEQIQNFLAMWGANFAAQQFNVYANPLLNVPGFTLPNFYINQNPF